MAASEFIKYIYEVVVEELLALIKINKFIAIIIDSQQTISDKEIMCLCVRYLDE